MRSVRIAACAATLVVVAVLAAVLLKPGDRLAGTNDAAVLGPVAVIPPGKVGCQPNQMVPAGADRLRMLISTEGKPAGPIAVELRKDGRTIGTGRAPHGFSDRWVDVPLASVTPKDVGDVTVCVRNAGRQVVAPLGEKEAPGPATARVPGVEQRFTIVIRMDWLQRGRPSWISYGPEVAERFPLAKASFFGEWTMWLVLAVSLAAAAGAIAVTVRNVRS